MFKMKNWRKSTLRAIRFTAFLAILLSCLGVAQEETWVSGEVSSDLNAPFNFTGWEGPGEVEKWTMTFDEFFAANYPNVQQVGNTGVAWPDYWTTLPAQLSGGAQIDLVWMHDSRVQTFANNEWLLPLDDYLTQFPIPGWPDKFVPSQVAAFNYEGKQYAIPYDWAPGGLYVNVDLFKAEGLDLPTEDWTWDDILEAAKKLTKDTDGDGQVDQWGISNLASVGSGPGSLYWIVKSFGGDYWNEEITESRMNEEGTCAAMQFLGDLIWEHQVMPTADAVAATGFGPELLFANGKVAMHYALNDTASRFAELIGDDFNWTVAPTPTGPAGRFQFVGGSAFAIPSTATQPQLAYELIRYTVSNPEVLPRTADMGSAYTSHLDYTDFVLPQDSPIRDAYEHTFAELGKRDGIFPQYHPKFLEWESSVFVSVFDRLWTGEERDASVLCKEADDLTNALLQQ
jgi:multiple sugar transport system substrate-binding protein